MYACAERLVRDGQGLRRQPVPGGHPGAAGRASSGPARRAPSATGPPAESLDLLRRMRAGEFPDGACVLRARIDMAHPNVLMRDPLLYRIRHAHHHRTGDAWCIYPMYDCAHPLEDAFEGVTHSICTLEFESNRELYDWVLDQHRPLGPAPPPVRVRPAGARLHGDVEAQAPAAREREAGLRLGRPAHAHHRRHAPARRHPGGAARLRRPHRRGQEQQRGRHRQVRVRHPGRPGGALARARWPSSTRSGSPSPTGPARTMELDLPWWPAEPDAAGAARSPSGATCSSSGTTSPPTRRPTGSGSRPGARCGWPAAFVVRCDEVRARTRPARWPALRCTPRPGLARGRRRAARARHHPLGPRRPLGARRRSGSTTGSSRSSSPTPPGTSSPSSTRPRSSSAPGARLEPALARRRARRPLPVPAGGLLLRRPGRLPARRPGLQPDHDAARTPGPAPGGAGRGPAPARARRRSPPPHAAPRKSRARRPGRAAGRRPRRWPRSTPATGDPRALRGAGRPPLRPTPATGRLVRRRRRGRRPAPASVARWLLNDLLGLAGDAPLGRAAAPGRRLRRASSRWSTPGAHHRRGGQGAAREPRRRRRRPGRAARRARAREGRRPRRRRRRRWTGCWPAQAAEVARYRAGEKKLLGVLLGAAMRETQGAADAAAVREVLLEKLG